MSDKKTKNFEDSLEKISKTNTPFVHADHRRPRTRRELLSSGFLSFASAAVLPSMLSIASNKAFGLECSGGESTGANKFMPYLHIELSGGAGLSGNYIFGKEAPGAAFEPLSADGYATLGFDGIPEINQTINDENGNPMIPWGGRMDTGKGVHLGLRQVMSDAAIQCTKIVGVPVECADDTRNNPFNAVQLSVMASGFNGNLIHIAGTRGGNNTFGRTNETPFGVNPGLVKAVVTGPEDTQALVDPGVVARALRPEDAVRITQAAAKLSESHLMKFNALTLPEQIRDLVRCGYLSAESLLSDFTADSLNPAMDTIVTGNPILNAAMNNNDTRGTMTIAKLLADNNTAAATMELGGFDYHGRGLQNRTNKDIEVGIKAGLCLQTAYEKGTPLFIAITSDGSVACQADGTPRSDSGSRGSMLMIAMVPNAAPGISVPQIGAFNDSGAVNTAMMSTTSNSAAAAGALLSYNYAMLNGKMDGFTKVMTASGSSNIFASDNKFLGFEPPA